MSSKNFAAVLPFDHKPVMSYFIS